MQICFSSAGPDVLAFLGVRRCVLSLKSCECRDASCLSLLRAVFDMACRILVKSLDIYKWRTVPGTKYSRKLTSASPNDDEWSSNLTSKLFPKVTHNHAKGGRDCHMLCKSNHIATISTHKSYRTFHSMPSRCCEHPCCCKAPKLLRCMQVCGTTDAPSSCPTGTSTRWQTTAIEASR